MEGKDDAYLGNVGWSGVLSSGADTFRTYRILAQTLRDCVPSDRGTAVNVNVMSIRILQVSDTPGVVVARMKRYQLRCMGRSEWTHHQFMYTSKYP